MNHKSTKLDWEGEDLRKHKAFMFKAAVFYHSVVHTYL